MRSKGGTLRALWLGKLLRGLRESAKLSLKGAGDHIIRDPSTISRMETGFIPARLSEVRELLKLYEVEDPEFRAGVEALTRDIWVKGWWDEYAGTIEVRVIDLAWLEARAEKLRDFSPLMIPGLFQTREYAQAIMSAAASDASDEQISQWLEFRMKRQEILAQLEHTVILDETVFARGFGGPEVMRAQLAHLLDLSTRPNITIRVLPFTAASPTGPESGFALFTLPSPLHVVAQVPTEAGPIYLETTKTARLETSWSRLDQHALDAEESRLFIKAKMEQFT